MNSNMAPLSKDIDIIEGFKAPSEVIANLNLELARKDEQLKASEVTIAGLEDQIVNMPLELATTRASEDELRNTLMNSHGASSSSSTSTHATHDTESALVQSSNNIQLAKTNRSNDGMDNDLRGRGRRRTENDADLINASVANQKTQCERSSVPWFHRPGRPGGTELQVLFEGNLHDSSTKNRVADSLSRVADSVVSHLHFSSEVAHETMSKKQNEDSVDEVNARELVNLSKLKKDQEHMPPERQSSMSSYGGVVVW